MTEFKKSNALNELIDTYQFRPDNNNPEQKYGLPSDVKFCVSCGISNQRPNSTVEFKHNNASTKKPSSLTKMVLVMRALRQNQSKWKLIGMKEELN